MGDFRSFQSSKRGVATAMEPVVDPAGWSPEHLRAVAQRIKQRAGDRAVGRLAGILGARRNQQHA